MKYITQMTGLALRVTDLDISAKFYSEIWDLEVMSRESDCVRFRGTGQYAPVLTLNKGSDAGLDYLVFAAHGLAAVEALAENLVNRGYQLLSKPGTEFPEGRYGLAVADTDGRELRITGAPAAVLPRQTSCAPIGLSHIVLNSPTGKANLKFFTDGLGMRLTDTVSYIPMSFLGCNRAHHCIALWDGSPRAFLNHVAYEVADVESFLRQAGKLVKRGCKVIAGPGRHTAGNNAFCYFIDPDGLVIEITTDMEMIPDVDSWVPRTWLVGEDQWGFGVPLGSEEMKMHTI